MQSGKVVNLLVVTTMLVALLLPTMTATADSVAQTLPFSQDWSNASLISTSDSWSGVPGIMGYRGDGLASTGDNPQSVLAFTSGEPVIDVNANQGNPNTFTTGGVTEFAIDNPVVALAGSGTADAPFILLSLSTLGWASPQISYNIRDIDGSSDNAIQQVALQYRIGDTGDFTDLPDGYIADATEGPSLATKVTPIKVVLPAITSNQPLVQIRIITVDAVGSDEWVGIDDIQITDTPPTVVSTAPASGEEHVNTTTDVVVNFSEPVNLVGDAFSILCSVSGEHTYTLTGGNPSSVFTLNPDGELNASEICTVTVIASQVTDNDSQDPPNMAEDYSFTFGTAGVPPTVISTAQALPRPMFFQRPT